jgi:hypothetical protein
MQYPNTQVQHIRVENTLSNSLLLDSIEVKHTPNGILHPNMTMSGGSHARWLPTTVNDEYVDTLCCREDNIQQQGLVFVAF